MNEESSCCNWGVAEYFPEQWCLNEWSAYYLGLKCKMLGLDTVLYIYI